VSERAVVHHALRRVAGRFSASRRRPGDATAAEPSAPSYVQEYERYVRRKLSDQERNEALAEAIGGEFEAFGKIELAIVREHGLLEPTGSVVDVGCGSGRLTKHMGSYLTSGSYLGTDVVDELLDRAAELAGRDDFEFRKVRELVIPVPDGAADVVCFFSVLTHLRHEQSFAYLHDARRAIRSGGRIVFSFLEFQVDSHWLVFESDLANLYGNRPLDQFISRDGIETWARHLELEIVGIYPGDQPYVAIDEPITTSTGQVFSGSATLGQSLCVLAVP